MPTVHLLIKGKVQGVFFRATAKEVADELGLTGWVQNTDEGHVEAMATGTEKQLNDFIAWCKQGPPRARVSEVIPTEKSEEHFDRFTVRR
ncbi:MAG TPA: acylphosphatase [Flavisolibacter sp.]|jgi:acylphosphatase